MSSNDFDGSLSGPVSGRGADEQGAEALGANGQSTGSGPGTGGNAVQYPAPEGWGEDGVWRDSAMRDCAEKSVGYPVFWWELWEL